MSVDEVWRARLDAPHDKSYLAFLHGVHEAVERTDGPTPNLWAGPVDLDCVPPSKRLYWANWNPVLQAMEDEIRSAVVERLGSVLHPTLTCDDPAVKPLADLLLEGHRVALLAEDKAATERSAPVFATYPIKPTWALIYCVKGNFRQAQPDSSENALNEAVAQYLSRGIPAGQARRYAISRNHVDRACKRFLGSLGGRVNSASTRENRDRIIQATFMMWNSRLETIEAIARAANSQPALRGKTGIDLVEAIDRLHGLHRVYYRVLDRQHLKRLA